MSIILSPATRISGGRSTRGLGRDAEVVRISGKDVVRIFGTDSVEFFDWYDNRHYHSGLALLTPATVHYGATAAVIEHRGAVLAAAYAAHPERFVRRAPRPAEPPTAVWINPPKSTDGNGDRQ